jgi:hypothetical protein
MAGAQKRQLGVASRAQRAGQANALFAARGPRELRAYRARFEFDRVFAGRLGPASEHKRERQCAQQSEPRRYGPSASVVQTGRPVSYGSKTMLAHSGVSSG